MKLYRRSSKRDINDVSEQLLRASGINNMEHSRPHGFATVIGFDFGDIYIDDQLFELGEDVHQEIDECLINLKKGDYGILSDDEIQENNESRWLGNGDVYGRYVSSVGILRIDKKCGETCIKLEGADV